MRKTIPCIFLLSLLLWQCKKPELGFEEEGVTAPVKSNIRFVFQHNDKIIMGGGLPGEKGFLMEWGPTLHDFKVISDSFPYPLYQGGYFKDRYVFTNERAEIIYSYDLVSFFPHWLRPENFVPDLHQQPGRKMVVGPDSSALFVVSGGEFEYGLIQRTADTFKTWVPTVFPNELHTIAFTPDGTGWAGGFGMLVKSTDGGRSWERIRFDNAYVSDIEFYTANDGIMATFDGQFYYTTDKGDHWKRAKRSGKSAYVNRITWLNENKAIAVGNNGSICVTRDRGKNWECDRTFIGLNLYDILILEPGHKISGRTIISAEDGIVWSLHVY